MTPTEQAAFDKMRDSLRHVLLADCNSETKYPEAHAALSAAKTVTHSEQHLEMLQSEIEAIAYHRCRRYIHIDTEAPYQFDGHTLMDFVRDVLKPR
jgi:hypothetical protein